MMEDEEAQAVLLEGMEGTQYITIERSQEGDSSLENQQFMTINMVTEMINGVGTEYNTATQYYETDDLLTHDMTEEDRKLAEALVAVQLEAQQKHRQNQHNNEQQQQQPLPDVSQLANLAPVSTFDIQSISSPTNQQPPPPAYSYKRNNVKQEFINVKSEYDIEVSAESSEDTAPNSGQKRSLPHKKRIARKLKQQTTKKSTPTPIAPTAAGINGKKDCGKIISQEIISLDVIQESAAAAAAAIQTFKCEICGSKFGGQLKFFEHLKSHYEPVKQETRIIHSAGGAKGVTIISTKNISPPTLAIAAATVIVPESESSSTPPPAAAAPLENSEIEEFSEPEDLMEGIRGVVEETGAHIDDENDGATIIDNSTTLWPITEVTQSINQQQSTTTTINEHDLQQTDDESLLLLSKIKDKKTIIKKKKKKTKDDMTCPECDRTFHHKNSLIYHLRSHTGERPHQCEVCGKSFFAASALKVHKRLHSGDKPYKCDDCGRNFRQWGDLKYHSMSIHSEQRQFQCEYCGKDFARKYSLIVHRRIHTGEKNYRCEFCNKTFRASSYLQNHRRIHTGEKPHPCDICGKPFRVRSDMKRHMQTHNRGRLADRLSSNNQTIQISKNNTTTTDDVQELKLEVEPNSVEEIMQHEDNPESILPHEGGQNIEYTVTPPSGGENHSDRDPLEAVRTSDTLQYFFM